MIPCPCLYQIGISYSNRRVSSASSRAPRPPRRRRPVDPRRRPAVAPRGRPPLDANPGASRSSRIAVTTSTSAGASRDWAGCADMRRHSPRFVSTRSSAPRRSHAGRSSARATAYVPSGVCFSRSASRGCSKAPLRLAVTWPTGGPPRSAHHDASASLPKALRPRAVVFRVKGKVTTWSRWRPSR